MNEIVSVAQARDMLLYPGGHARSMLALASEVVVTEMDRRGHVIERVRVLLKDESRHRIRMDGNWVKWSDIADALDGPP